jgi:GNAT superfamily N-acetyltransferase
MRLSRKEHAMRWERDGFVVTTDTSAVDVDAVKRLLETSYWAAERSAEDVAGSIEHSVCFSLLKDGAQIGFARLVTDYTTIAWVADVIIDQAWRGRGLGTWLMSCVMENPETKRCRKILRTRDAFSLYAKFGFGREWGGFMMCPPINSKRHRAILSALRLVLPKTRPTKSRPSSR